MCTSSLPPQKTKHHLLTPDRFGHRQLTFLSGAGDSEHSVGLHLLSRVNKTLVYIHKDKNVDRHEVSFKVFKVYKDELQLEKHKSKVNHSRKQDHLS